MLVRAMTHQVKVKELGRTRQTDHHLPLPHCCFMVSVRFCTSVHHKYKLTVVKRVSESHSRPRLEPE